MESIIALIILALTGAVFFKNRSDKQKAQQKLVETKAKDAGLQLSQKEIEDVIDDIDAGIERIKREKEAADNEAEKNMTLAERRARIRKGLN